MRTRAAVVIAVARALAGIRPTPALVALVGAGAVFVDGKLVQRPEGQPVHMHAETAA